MSGRKFYDLVLHYFHFSAPHPLTGVVEISMNSRVMFLQEHQGPENASSIRSSFDLWLSDLYDTDFKTALSSFTFVTDCASTMPCIAGSSSRKVPFCERWIGCIAHQLNTAMKKVIAARTQSESKLRSQFSNKSTSAY